jgi:hypothetical protein
MESYVKRRSPVTLNFLILGITVIWCQLVHIKAFPLAPKTLHSKANFHSNQYTIRPVIQTSKTTKLYASKISSSTFPFEFFRSLETAYAKTCTTVKCPFFKRRIADTIDSLAMILRFILLRHKSLLTTDQIILLDEQYHRMLSTDSNYYYNHQEGIDTRPHQQQVEDIKNNHYMSVVPGCRAVGRHVLINERGQVIKHKHLPLAEIQQVILNDWAIHNHKGYYITGRLNSTIYRDDCLFDGPDPDMPVRGLRKYLNAASQLFDPKTSRATLLDIRIADNDVGQHGGGVIQVSWMLEGVLMLPWHPTLPQWTGWTKYHLDKDGLIAFHEEGWNIGVVEAFVKTLTPHMGGMFWHQRVTKGNTMVDLNVEVEMEY